MGEGEFVDEVVRAERRLWRQSPMMRRNSAGTGSVNSRRKNCSPLSRSK